MDPRPDDGSLQPEAGSNQGVNHSSATADISSTPAEQRADESTMLPESVKAAVKSVAEQIHEHEAWSLLREQPTFSSLSIHFD